MKRAIIVVLVLVGVLVGADFAAAALAESAVSRQMREQIGLADDPAVHINGFPFLVQALSGHYGSVDVKAEHIKVGQLQDLQVTAQLRDVEAPLSMLLGSGEKTLLIGAAQGTVRVPAKDLERLVNRDPRWTIDKLRIDRMDERALTDALAEGSDPSVAQIDPDKAARLTADITLPVLGKNEVSVIAVLDLVDGKAQLSPRDIRFGEVTLPSPVERALRQLFTISIDPGSLPLQVTPTALTAVDGTLQVSGRARNLTLGGTPQPATTG